MHLSWPKSGPVCSGLHAMFQDLKSQFGSSLHSVTSLLQRPLTLCSGPRAVPAPGGSADRAASKLLRRAAAIRMQTDLADLLDQHASARQLMRYLDLVERALGRSLSAWERLPLKVHVRALAELEKLVRDWSNDGLAELRSRTAVLVKNRPADDALHSPDLDATQRADVSEVEHSIYEESQRSWAGGDPAVAASAALAFAPTQPG